MVTADLTLAEAAARLDQAESSVRRLLKIGDLQGPDLAPGRQRHPRNAPRVFAASIEDYLKRTSRSSADPSSRTDTMGERHRRPASSPDRAALQAMKIRLDEALDLLAVARRRNGDLRQMLSRVEAQLEAIAASTEEADAVDALARGYSEALTQLLANDDLSTLPD